MAFKNTMKSARPTSVKSGPAKPIKIDANFGGREVGGPSSTSPSSQFHTFSSSVHGMKSSYDGDHGHPAEGARYNSHGVSEQWIRDRVKSGLNKATKERAIDFHNSSKAQGDYHNRWQYNATRGDTPHEVRSGEKRRIQESATYLHEGKNSRKSLENKGSDWGLTFGAPPVGAGMPDGKKGSAGKQQREVESGWARWKAKKAAEGKKK